jgi:hypothetical protein
LGQSSGSASIPVSLLDNAVLVCRPFAMLFALAAQFTLPIPANGRVPDVRALFTADDVPGYLVSQGEVDRTVYTRTTVRPDGIIQGCAVEGSSGDPRLDAYTCALIVRRAKFLPARWTDGSAAYGVIRVPVRWRVTNSAPPKDDSLSSNIPDLDLSVNQLPKGAGSVAGVTLKIAADENGRPVTCAEWPRLDDHSKHFAELVPIACQQITALTLSPPVDASGKAVRSIQTVSVRFKLGR